MALSLRAQSVCFVAVPERARQRVTVCRSTSAPGSTAFPNGVGAASFHQAATKPASATPAAGPGTTGAGTGTASFTNTGTASFHATPASGSSKAAADAASLSPFQAWVQQNRELKDKIQALGIAGVAAYGLFNTLYYTCAFLFVGVYVAKVPSGLGLAKAAQQYAQVFAMVWAGSQVTKLARAGAALAAAPLVDRGLGWLADSLKLKGKQQAFLVLVAGCLSLAALLFGGVVLMHA